MTVQPRETRNVFSENPIVFLLDLEEAIHDGFRVENTIPGYPSLNSILKEVRVFRPITTDLEKPQKYVDDVEVRISNYDPMLFLLDVQDAILEGFEVDRQRVSFDTHGVKTCTLVRTEVTPQISLDDDLIVAPAPVEDAPAEAKPRKPRKAKGEAK